MILLDTKTQTSPSSSPLSLSVDDGDSKPDLTFSQLLQGISSKSDDKVVQNGALLLALAKDAKDFKGAYLATLTKVEATPTLKETPLELNPQITKNVSPSELKSLVSDAKNYLKTKILESEGFKKSEIQELPKTLKGLVAVAKKFGLDVSKITIEDIKISSKIATKIETPVALKQTALPTEVQEKPIAAPMTLKDVIAPKAASTKPHTESPVTLKQEASAKPHTESPVTLKQEASVKPHTESPVAPKQEAQVKPHIESPVTLKQETSAKSHTESPVALKQETSAKPHTETPVTLKQETSAKPHTESPVALKQEAQAKPHTESLVASKQEEPAAKEVLIKTTVNKQVQEKRLDEDISKNTTQIVKEKEVVTKSVYLFKEQVSKEITTEQLVEARVHTSEKKTPKSKADETLKMLISGEKVAKKEVGFTADFSVATARVIGAQATTQSSVTQNSFESLLRGDNSANAEGSKLDGLNVAKSDSLEVKLNEAKQMTKYISQDVKTAIEDYKSPFTRVKVQLNPQRLGEVELTVVQRGKNLHVTLSSNNAAINALALNSNDLRAQLTNNGINNATLNFNNNSSGEQQNFSGNQQQNSHRDREAQKEYDYYDNEEQNEEIANSLEIVVPNYA